MSYHIDCVYFDDVRCNLTISMCVYKTINSNTGASIIVGMIVVVQIQDCIINGSQSMQLIQASLAFVSPHNCCAKQQFLINLLFHVPQI
jgi:hypothetical protein